MSTNEKNSLNIAITMARAAAAYIDAAISATPDVQHTTASLAALFRLDARRVLNDRGLSPIRHADARARTWHCRAQFWGADGSATVDKLLGEDEVTCEGFAALAMWLAKAALDGHGPDTPEEMRTFRLMERLNNLRPTISRQAGVGNMRFAYTDLAGRPFQLHARVAWAERALALDAEESARRGQAIVPLRTAPRVDADRVTAAPRAIDPAALESVRHGTVPESDNAAAELRQLFAGQRHPYAPAVDEGEA